MKKCTGMTLSSYRKAHPTGRAISGIHKTDCEAMQNNSKDNFFFLLVICIYLR